MAVWLTVGFFEPIEARVNVAGMTYQNRFQCIPASLPASPAPGRGVWLQPRTPLGIASPPGPLLDRLEAALRKNELLPYIEVRPIGGGAGNVLRLDKVRVQGVSPMSTKQTRQVSIVVEL